MQMALHKNIGENAAIDSGTEIEDVSYEPTEVETDIIEEKSDAQQLKDGDAVLAIDQTAEVEVSPHSVYTPPVKKEEGEEVEEEEEVEKEEVVEEKEKIEEEQEEEEADPAEEKKKPASAPDKVQQRINKITREKYEALRENERLVKKLAELETTQKETKFAADKSALEVSKPKQEDFDTDEEYYTQLGRWGAKMELHEQQSTQEAEVIKEEPKNIIQTIIDTGKETYPDFEELVLREDLKITPAMVESAADSEYATEIFYHLGQHPELAEKIAKLRSPAAVAREMGRIEFNFIQAEVVEVVTHEPTQDTEEVVTTKIKNKKKKTPVVPPPVKPLGGGGKTSTNLEDMSLADYYEARGYTRDGMKKRDVS